MTRPARRWSAGGEFELQGLHLGPLDTLRQLTRGMVGTWSLSGRAALAMVLRHLRTKGVSHVHLPSYLCQSLLQPVQQMGFEFSFYPLDLRLEAHPDPPANAAVLLIHYFGWINPASAPLRENDGSTYHLVEDASQALLSEWSPGPAVAPYVIMSLRKFGPVPLGGWCNLSTGLEDTSPQAEILTWRSIAARLARGIYLADTNAAVDSQVEMFCLDAFRAMERFLDEDSDLTAAPTVALELAAGFDWEDAARRRRQNWHTLNELLSPCVEAVHATLPEKVVPLGYVVRLPEAKRDEIRARLVGLRVFCPVYWPLPAEISQERFPEAARFSRTLLSLPVDHRYDPADMELVAQAFKVALCHAH